MWRLRCVLGALVAVLPSLLKVWVLRWLYRYEIGQGVRIGFGVVFAGVRKCTIGDHCRIGPLNLFYGVEELQIGEHCRIGSFNLFRGGERIEIGPYASVMRCNVFNAILDPVVVNPFVAALHLGRGTVVTTGHWLDFSDQISIGNHTIIGGRNSSFWTHNRQRTRPITIGEHCYLGSDIRVAPGVEVPPFCIVALGAVLMKRYDESRSLIAGNPATVLRPLTERDMFLVMRRTRDDLPELIDESIGQASLDDDLTVAKPGPSLRAR